jgi:predicted TIM-barrel fold metal-dependent hydrolase
VALAMAGALPALTLFDWMFSGVFARFPRLRLVLSEGKLGWIPFALEHADYVWHRHRRIWGSALPDPPSEYFADHVFGCFLPFERFGTRQIREIGVDNCMLETDYPHPDTSWPDTGKHLRETLAHLDDAEFERVTRANALRVFGFDTMVGQ